MSGTKLKKKVGLKKLPNRSDGVREMSNQRAKLMARPICPVITDSENPRYLTQPAELIGSENCQVIWQNQPQWWLECEKAGHDPYYSVQRKIVKEEITDETGYITGERKRVIEKKRLNLVRVPIGIRFHSGRGEAISRGLKGRRSLTEMGYSEKCEFRNCEQEAEILTKYGIFCGERHARLVGADVEAVFLHVKPAQRSRERDFKEIDLEFEGTTVLQVPPDLEGMA